MPASHALPAGNSTLSLHAAASADTEAIGRTLASALAPGDVVALHGPLGAGKSHFARAAIRARLRQPRAEVPSPSYTLVNVYECPEAEIWHVDLYRVDPEELAEIGLMDAPRNAILMVEWAERWPDLPRRRLDIFLEFEEGGGRRLIFEPKGPGWQRVMRVLGSA